jgi:hypothetical protein
MLDRPEIPGYDPVDLQVLFGGADATATVVGLTADRCNGVMAGARGVAEVKEVAPTPEQTPREQDLADRWG